MKDPARARVAAIVGAAVRKNNVSSVYDYNAGNYRNASVKVDGGKVTGYDYGTSSHFSGSNSSDGKLDFYDYETSSHVQLKLEGNRFSGYDYHTSSHFVGTLSGNSISLYDYETGKYYSFSI